MCQIFADVIIKSVINLGGFFNNHPFIKNPSQYKPFFIFSDRKIAAFMGCSEDENAH